jgi:hypothetical protein
LEPSRNIYLSLRTSAWATAEYLCILPQIVRAGSPLRNISMRSGDVRFWGLSGHYADMRRCLLMTRSGHSGRNPALQRADSTLVNAVCSGLPSRGYGCNPMG